MTQGKLGVRGGIGRRRRVWVLCALATAACSRNVKVDEQNQDTPDATRPSDAVPGSAGQVDAGGKTNLLDGIDQNQPDAGLATSDATPAKPQPDSASSPTGDAARIPDTRAITDAVKPVPADAFVAPTGDAANLPSTDTAPIRDTAPSLDALVKMDTLLPVDAAPPKDTSSAGLITGLQVLADGLTAIEVPAVGSDRVSVLQYSSTTTSYAMVVTWDGAVSRWYESSAAQYMYLAASGTHQVSLLYLASAYPIQQNGTATELSGTPTTYKEYLSANDSGYAWIDYPQGGGGGGGGRQGGGGGAPASTSMGTVVFQTWQGARTSLTDALRYRARVDLSSTHAAYVEYADTTTGTPGQIVVQPLGGGAASMVAASTHHQDRPAVDGNWVVWEEYLSSTDSVIRAKNLTTNEVRNLSSTTGFRTNPDIRGSRVVWEDQRSGNGDIYTFDLAANNGEQIAVSGAGHSTGARLTTDGLVWMEASGNNIGLLRARWR